MAETLVNKQELQQLKRDDWKAIIRRVMLFNPKYSILQLQRVLRDGAESIDLSYPTLTGLVKEIREERIKNISEQTRVEVAATFEELTEFVNNQLRAIAQEERLTYLRGSKEGERADMPEVRTFAQQNRLRALQGIISNYERLIKLKIELGVLERKLGGGDLNIRAILYEIRQFREGNSVTEQN